MEAGPSSAPETKTGQKNKARNNAGSTLDRSASCVHWRFDLAAYVSRSPRCFQVSRQESEGGHSPASGSLPLRNWGRPLSSVDPGGEVQRSAGERQEGRHSPARRPSRLALCDRGLLHKRLWRLCLQHQSRGGEGLGECDIASGVCWTVGVQRADIS